VALGKDPASQDVSKIFEESEIMRSKIQPGCIVLRIVDGSQEFSDFNDFWTVHGTPMIFFMNGKGEMVRDPLAGAVTEAQILRALVAIKTEQVGLTQFSLTPQDELAIITPQNESTRLRSILEISIQNFEKVKNLNSRIWKIEV